jgi:hypothetical protein
MAVTLFAHVSPRCFISLSACSSAFFTFSRNFGFGSGNFLEPNRMATVRKIQTTANKKSPTEKFCNQNPTTNPTSAAGYAP